MPLSKRLIAELVGTFWLVFGGIGSAVFAAKIVALEMGATGVALAFGLTLLTMAYAIGHISGCHINPAVSVGLWVGGRFPLKEVVPYIVVQLVGGWLGAGLVYAIASGKEGFELATSLAPNGYGLHSPAGYSLLSALLVEITLTFGFILTILGATDKRVPKGFAPLPIGLALTLVHLIGIPVTNMSVNPARSTGPALYLGGWALSQLWLFWVAPIAGALIAGLVYRLFFSEYELPATEVNRQDINVARPKT